jgi:cobalt-zinc-cadmium efflux system outer membrane protein
MKACHPILCGLLLAGLGGCQGTDCGLELRDLLKVGTEFAIGGDLDAKAAEALTRPSSPPPPLLPPTLGEPVQLAACRAGEQPTPQKDPQQKLKIPSGLPGGIPEPIRTPQTKTEVNKLYRPAPELENELVLAPGPEGRPLTLADLQQLAVRYSPAIRAAEASVVAAQGAMRQSLAYPNPAFFFENDTNATGTAGYPGFGIDQVIKTSNKLELQGAAAKMDLFNAQLALRRARFDVAYQVRTNYFNVLVAQENVKVSRAFALFTEEIYVMQVKLLQGNQAAAYTPLQLRPLALQARFNLTQATNQFYASWRQLTSSLGLPEMPPTEVTGRVDLPVPLFDFEAVRQRVLSQHTDVLTAKNNIYKARFNLRLAQVQPVPDVDLHLLVQKDYTTPPFYTVLSVTATIPVPVWDLNRGGIQQAQGNLTQAMHNLPVAQNALNNSLADAYNRYVTNRKQVAITLEQVVDQLRVYQALYNHYRGGGKDVAFADLVTAQQALAGYVSSYVAALGLQWTAVADVANLMQTDDLFKGTHGRDNPDVPPLEQLEATLRCLPLAAATEQPTVPTAGATLSGTVLAPGLSPHSPAPIAGIGPVGIAPPTLAPAVLAAPQALPVSGEPVQIKSGNQGTP